MQPPRSFLRCFELSSYIDAVNPGRHAPYLDIPDDVIEYLHYLDFVKLRSPRTVNGYYLDLRGFFRYMMIQWRRAQADVKPESIDLTHITTQDIAGITKRDIFSYLDYARSADNGPKARARKLSALKGFFGYMCTQVNRLSQNPTENVTLGTPKKSLPKYLTQNESLDLLNNIQSDFYERDFCIITMFLNCGMRLTELITINLGDFRDDTEFLLQGCVAALYSGPGHIEQPGRQGCSVCVQANRQTADRSPRGADRGPMPAKRRTERTRIFTPQVAAYSRYADVPGWCRYAGS